MNYREVNFDGLVGPTHHYAGLSFGNVASMGNEGRLASPRGAALEGLKKMKALHDAGLVQGVIPPHARPHLATLRAMGFTGSTSQTLSQALEHAPRLLSAASSASAMWVANAATVSPSPDTRDNRLHFTAANLQAKLHRSIEHPVTSRILKGIFPESSPHFAHHPALPTSDMLGDEGAANHTRLCCGQGSPGVEIFTYGKIASDTSAPAPKRFPARQSREASALIARNHQLDPERVVLVQQTPEVIDAGVFHNDVIAVGNDHVLLIHELAWCEQEQTLERLDALLGGSLCAIVVPQSAVSVEDAVSSYLFNSQIVTLPDGQMNLICAIECQQNEDVRQMIEEIVADAANPISAVRYFDLTQSMRNGGGPACLRLRVTLSDDELAAVNASCLLDAQKYDELTDWVTRHYRETLSVEELGTMALFEEVQRAFEELAQILSLDPAIFAQT